MSNKCIIWSNLELRFKEREKTDIQQRNRRAENHRFWKENMAAGHRTMRNEIRTFWIRFYEIRSLKITRKCKWTSMVNIKSSIIKILDNRMVRRYGHVKRMSEDRWLKKILDWYPPGRRKTCRPLDEMENICAENYDW